MGRQAHYELNIKMPQNLQHAQFYSLTPNSLTQNSVYVFRYSSHDNDKIKGEYIALITRRNIESHKHMNLYNEKR